MSSAVMNVSDICHSYGMGINKFIFEGNQMEYWAPLGKVDGMVVCNDGPWLYDTSKEAGDLRRQLRLLMVNDAWNCAYDHSLGPVKARDRAHWTPFMKKWGVHKTTNLKTFVEPRDDFLSELEAVVVNSKRT